MPPSGPKIKGKRRTRQHIIADLSINHVERLVLRCGFTVESVRHDYGIDLAMRVYDSVGEAQSGEVLMQLKASDNLKFIKGGEFIAWPLSYSDLASWLREPMPVILVVYDAKSETAYWEYVQAYFELLPNFNLQSGKRSVTIRVPVTHVLDEEAVRIFARYRNNVLQQIQGVVSHAQASNL